MARAVQLEQELRFDYSIVPLSVAKFLKGHAKRIRDYARVSALAIGKDLLLAKRYLSHGTFIQWVEEEVGIPARTAQSYMQVAHWISDKSASVAHLPITVLYLLSAPGTPRDLIETVLEKAERGERIEPQELRRELKSTRALGPKRPDDDCETSSDGDLSAVIEAIRIIERGLSENDFNRVRSILASERLLACRQLARHLATAFEVRSVGRGECVESEVTSLADQRSKSDRGRRVREAGVLRATN